MNIKELLDSYRDTEWEKFKSEKLPPNLNPVETEWAKTLWCHGFVVGCKATIDNLAGIIEASKTPQ